MLRFASNIILLWSIATACTKMHSGAADDGSPNAGGRKADEVPIGVPGYEITIDRFGVEEHAVRSAIRQPIGLGTELDVDASGRRGLKFSTFPTSSVEPIYVLAISTRPGEDVIPEATDGDEFRRYVFDETMFIFDRDNHEIFLPISDEILLRTAFVASAVLPRDKGYRARTKSLALGGSHTCAIVTDGKIKCWGEGAYLGLESTSNRGDDASDESHAMGTALPYVDLDHTDPETAATVPFVASQIAVGERHTCALSTTGQVKCWGYTPVLGLGLSSDTNVGDSAGEMGPQLPYVNLGSGRYAIDISAADYYTCAVLDDGSAKCWGCPPRPRL